MTVTTPTVSKNLDLKPINELLGEHFYIPYYQRGYRWTSQQVNDLLNDIWAFTNQSKSKESEFYCLQPIVVKQKIWHESGQELKGWEVIDGQQRLTTIHIIINYLTKEFLKAESLLEDYGKELYSLRYETRPKSAEFLKNITDDNSNIDFYHINKAYKTVKEWFINGKNTVDRTDKNKFLATLLGKKDDERSVQIIWYKVDAKEGTKEEESKKSIELFTRLNIGKIPLTNAELIKALFLSSSSFEKESHDDAIRMKMEISQMWDEMEQKLSDEHFWSFVTNAQQRDYPTKIELLFDAIAGKDKDKIDPLYTFLNFLGKSKDNSKPLWDLWLSIEQYYMTLCQWYSEKNLYHKIGYLISVGEDLGKMVRLSMEEKKDNFENQLNIKINKSVDFEIENLSYEKTGDYEKIAKVLLLFNVESIRKNEYISEFYPFQHYKSAHWSLEHIHAQNSESLDKTKKEQWIAWLNNHEKLIVELLSEEKDNEKRAEWQKIQDEISQINYDKLTWEKFNALANVIIARFSENIDDHSDDPHSISNLALLSHHDNAALNNAVFEVKRRAIIEMDKRGSYIPLCTRRVFLKYYNEKPSTQQYYFWGRDDRKNYLQEVKEVLKNYLPQENLNLN